MAYVVAVLILVMSGGSGFAQPPPPPLSMTNPVAVELIKPRVPRDQPARPPCTIPCKRVAVIFVHGITGDTTTWKHKDAETDWPQMLVEDINLQNEIQTELDVYRVSYYSTRTEGPSVTNISGRLAAELDSKLFGNKYSKVVMVCHSLGGILCRAHLLHVKLRWGHAYLALFKATFTFGTPLKGSDQAERLIVRASANEQVRVLRVEEVNDFLQLMNKSTEEFRHKGITLGCPPIEFYAGYEELETPFLDSFPNGPRELFVNAGSATFGDNIVARGFNMDHRKLVKPRDRGDDAYKWVAGMLRTCGPTGGGVCNQPISPTCGRPSWL